MVDWLLCAMAATAKIPPQTPPLGCLSSLALLHHWSWSCRNVLHLLTLLFARDLPPWQKSGSYYQSQSFVSCLCPVTSMQSHGIFAPLRSYSLLFHICHCQMLYGHFRKPCLWHLQAASWPGRLTSVLQISK